jgi:hypothetical protein
MDAVKDSITPGGHQAARPVDEHGNNAVAKWARGRQRITPWVYPYLRGLGALRLGVGAALLVVSALLLSRGHDGWAAIPLAGAVVSLAVGGLDTAAARAVRDRG